jgi:hypothetical protein
MGKMATIKEQKAWQNKVIFKKFIRKDSTLTSIPNKLAVSNVTTSGGLTEEYTVFWEEWYDGSNRGDKCIARLESFWGCYMESELYKLEVKNDKTI